MTVQEAKAAFLAAAADVEAAADAPEQAYRADPMFAEVDDDSARIPRAPISPAARAAAADMAEQGRRAAESALASVIMPLPARTH